MGRMKNRWMRENLKPRCGSVFEVETGRKAAQMALERLMSPAPH